MAQLRQDPPASLETAIVVELPIETGFALVRVFVADESLLQSAVERAGDGRLRRIALARGQSASGTLARSRRAEPVKVVDAGRIADAQSEIEIVAFDSHAGEDNDLAFRG